MARCPPQRSSCPRARLPWAASSCTRRLQRRFWRAGQAGDDATLEFLPPSRRHPRGVVAVDGKSLRKAYERGRACAPPLMVSVWDAETRVSIAAARAPGGNEVAATLALLKTLVLKGCIVTADALHCHPRMAEGVLASGADYALGLKGNHGPLHAAAVSAFDAKGFLPFFETAEEAHDRKEWRCASVLPAPADAPAFPGLAALARKEGEVACDLDQRAQRDTVE